MPEALIHGRLRGNTCVKWNSTSAPAPRAAMIAAKAAGGSCLGSVVPRSHHSVGMPNTITLAIENARNTRVRMSCVPRSHAATPIAR